MAHDLGLGNLYINVDQSFGAFNLSAPKVLMQTVSMTEAEELWSNPSHVQD
jgi:hypothetical protein